MKSLKALVMALVMIVSVGVMPAAAQFKFGVRAGMNVNSLHFSKDNAAQTFSASNRAGWTGGLLTEFTVPLVGVGVDLSAMYVHRVTDAHLNNIDKAMKSDYIEIPLNVRYNFSLPVVGNVVAPYLAVGPSVSFLASKKGFMNAYERKAVDWAINFGVGVRFFKHLDLNARYGLGLSNSLVRLTGVDTTSAGIAGKNRYWTITAGWIF
ncbi:MAG: porin family protein [Duncaniella sp.]|nr:porin family protein [Duncaniella sp.]